MTRRHACKCRLNVCIAILVQWIYVTATDSRRPWSIAFIYDNVSVVQCSISHFIINEHTCRLCQYYKFYSIHIDLQVCLSLILQDCDHWREKFRCSKFHGKAEMKKSKIKRWASPERIWNVSSWATRRHLGRNRSCILVSNPRPSKTYFTPVIFGDFIFRPDDGSCNWDIVVLSIVSVGLIEIFYRQARYKRYMLMVLYAAALTQNERPIVRGCANVK